MSELNLSYVAEVFYLTDDGTFPNNNLLPVIHYKQVINLSPFFSASDIIKLFEENKWSNTWKNGIFTYHHYHSNTHEALGAYEGRARIMLGGERGKEVLFEKGDVLIIPAGVAHKNLDEQSAIKCVGAYPGGSEYDINYGKIGERPQADRNIKAVPIPGNDPVFGSVGELKDLWR